MGITQRDFPHKSLYARRKKGKEVRGQRGGGVRVWRSLFLASEKSGVCGQWKRKGSVGILTWSSAVAFILHDPCESEGAARVGGGVHQNTNKWHTAYMVHTETQEEVQHKICWGEQWNSSDRNVQTLMVRDSLTNQRSQPTGTSMTGWFKEHF